MHEQYEYDDKDERQAQDGFVVCTGDLVHAISNKLEKVSSVY
jgi:hypothetical protein